MVTTGFGYALPGTGQWKIEFEGIDAIIEFLETENKQFVEEVRDSIKQENAAPYKGLQEVYHVCLL